MNNEEYIRNLVDDTSIDLMDMYDKIQQNCDDMLSQIYRRNNLIDIMCGHAKEQDTFIAMAEDLEANRFADLFLFDWSCWGNGCTPIETKEELASACIDGCV